MMARFVLQQEQIPELLNPIADSVSVCVDTAKSLTNAEKLYGTITLYDTGQHRNTLFGKHIR